MRRFPLAPMDPLFATLTRAVLLIPPVMLVGAVFTGPAAPILVLVAAFVVAVYASVWFLGRPQRFEVDGDELRVVFPAWTRTVSLATVTGVDRYEGNGFREQVGWGVRVGAGGLWGVFGWLYTPIGWVEVYSSRIRDVALVRFTDRIPLLVSPNDIDAFAKAIER